MTRTQIDAQKISVAFRQIYNAALVIADVFHSNEDLNRSIPGDWPLSTDEFAAIAAGMTEHYALLASGRIQMEDRT